jgi:hypothetical protein
VLIFLAAETGVCVPLPSKLTSASAAIPAFRPCLQSRCLVMDYSVIIRYVKKECDADINSTFLYITGSIKLLLFIPK